MCFRTLIVLGLFLILTNQSSIPLYTFEYQNQRILIQFRHLLKLDQMEFLVTFEKFIERNQVKVALILDSNPHFMF